jgi:hypothetical protein
MVALRQAVKALTLLAAMGSTAAAQQAAPPTGAVLAGIVVDTAGKPVDGVEITVPDLRARTFTRVDGTYRFENVPPGTYQMRARKIGFGPLIRRYSVDSLGGFGRFTLTPFVQGLPPMISVAGRRGLSGNVTDLGFTPVPGATVRALGIRATTKTDSRGDFFLPMEAGRYMVSIAKDSFDTKLVSVLIPPDSGRHVDARLVPGGKVRKEHYWNIEDLRQRQAWGRPQDRVLLTHEDLVDKNIVWIYDAVASSASRFQFTEAISKDCMVVVNGGPEIANLSTLTIDEIESVELYPALNFKTGRDSKDAMPTVAAASPQGKAPWGGPSKNASRAQGGKFVWMDNTRIAAFENRTRNCPGIYVWLR